MIIRKADLEDLNIIISIFESGIKTMCNSGIYQWDDIYPTSDVIKEDILKNEMYVGTKDNIIVSAFAVNNECDEQYKNGMWKYSSENYAVIHRLCVNPDYQNQKIARNTMIEIEEILTKQGVESIRLDAFSLNPYALKLYENLGYEKVGEASWRKGLFYLLEKKL